MFNPSFNPSIQNPNPPGYRPQGKGGKGGGMQPPAPQYGQQGLTNWQGRFNPSIENPTAPGPQSGMSGQNMLAQALMQPRRGGAPMGGVPAPANMAGRRGLYGRSV